MAIVDHEVKSDGLPQIVVKDTVDALGELARYNIVRRRELDGDFDIIGLTGSVGKTTTKDLLSSLLATVGPTVAPVGSFNNEIGLPLTALRVDEHTRFFVAEMGASHIGEIARLTRIAPPNTAIVLKSASLTLENSAPANASHRRKAKSCRDCFPEAPRY